MSVASELIVVYRPAIPILFQRVPRNRWPISEWMASPLGKIYISLRFVFVYLCLKIRGKMSLNQLSGIK